MAETDNVLDEILNHGPSANSISIVLTRMKKAGHLKEVVQECIKFLRVYPDDIRLRSILAESYLEIGFIGLAGAELEKVKEELKDVKSELKRKDDIIDTATKANKYAMSTFSYLAKKFVDTPVLGSVQGKQLDTIMYKDHNTEDDFKLVESLVYYYRFKRLHEYIGDTIVLPLVP